MYDSKNKSGVPTPCNVCPTTTDYLVAVVMNVVKRCVAVGCDCALQTDTSSCWH
jgi:hypothetical protein